MTDSAHPAEFFLGDVPQLKSEQLVWSREDRFRLRTVSGGCVRAVLAVLLKDFNKHGVKF